MKVLEKYIPEKTSAFRGKQLDFRPFNYQVRPAKQSRDINV